MPRLRVGDDTNRIVLIDPGGVLDCRDCCPKAPEFIDQTVLQCLSAHPDPALRQFMDRFDILVARLGHPRQERVVDRVHVGTQLLALGLCHRLVIGINRREASARQNLFRDAELVIHLTQVEHHREDSDRSCLRTGIRNDRDFGRRGDVVAS